MSAARVHLSRDRRKPREDDLDKGAITFEMKSTRMLSLISSCVDVLFAKALGVS